MPDRSLSPVPDPIDWGTRDTYDPHAILTSATDGRGQSTEIRVRVPPTLAGQIQGLIQGRDNPGYRTMADFARDAVYHRLRFVVEEMVGQPTPRMLRRMRGELASAELRRMREEMTQARERVQEAKDVLRMAGESGHAGLLREAISEAQELAIGLDEPWLSQIETAIRDAKRGA